MLLLLLNRPPEASLQTLQPEIYTNNNSIPNLVITVPGSTLNLTIPLLSNTNTLYGPVLGIGARGLSPSLYSNTNTLYTPVLGIGATSLLSALYSNTNTLYNHSISVVSPTANLLPGLYSNTNSLYTPTLNLGSFNILPNLYSNTNNLYSASVLVGSRNLSTSLYSNTNNLYLASVLKGSRTLLPAIYTNTAQYYVNSVIKGSISSYPGLYTNINNIFAPDIPAQLYVNYTVNNNLFYAQLINSNTILKPNINFVQPLTARYTLTGTTDYKYIRLVPISVYVQTTSSDIYVP